jgi:hypothetical protein
MKFGLKKEYTYYVVFINKIPNIFFFLKYSSLFLLNLLYMIPLLLHSIFLNKSLFRLRYTNLIKLANNIILFIDESY